METVQDEKRVRREAQDLYRNLGWPSLFARLKFYFAPLVKIEALIPQEGLIIDLGCGYGLFSHYIGVAEPKRTVLGFDLDESKTKYGDRGCPNVSCRYGDITKVEIPPADCIVFTHVLHHLTSYESQKDLLLTCKNKLKDGGALIVTEVGEKPLWKHFLCYVADRILYPHDKLHYRTNEEMGALLSEIFHNVEVIPMDEGTWFSHVTFRCVKRAE
jgi:2-polyprenyl-3-methyl-5-hydroxy-6-metoxy-1,4-benzoquinol methylase